MKEYIIGIDPGLNGGGAVLDLEGNLIKVFPLIPEKAQKSEAVRLLGETSARELAKYAFDTNFVVIEKVGSMPGQGVASTFKFGIVTGVLHGICHAYGLPIFEIAPSVWKGSLGLSKNKRESLDLSVKLWPAFSHEFKRMKDDGKAEAALIAYYYWKNLKRRSA